MRALGKKKNAVVAVALAAGLALGGYAALRSKHEGGKLLVNRVWIDRLPEHDTDHFELLVLVDDEPLGLFRKASQYEGTYAIFRYELRGDDKVQLLFPQDKSKHEVKYDARACDVKDFDYCLDLTGAPRGAKRYVSRKEWELGDARDVGEIQAAVAAWAAEHAKK